MKKKIFQTLTRCCCLAAACCLILAGAAAPLTAYAAEDDGSGELDVAQETRTLVGTWRWNDEIDFSSLPGSGVLDLYFTVSPGFVLDEETGLVSFVGSSLPFYGIGVSLEPSSSFDVTIESSIVYVDGSDSDLFMYLDISSENLEDAPEIALYDGWSGAAFMVLILQSFAEVENPNWEILLGWGQTIKIPYAQEVPVEFYDWFTANAVRVVSPTERLMEGLSAVGTGIWTGVSGVANTITSNPLLLFTTGFLFLGGCIGLFGRLLSRS